MSDDNKIGPSKLYIDGKEVPAKDVSVNVNTTNPVWSELGKQLHAMQEAMMKESVPVQMEVIEFYPPPFCGVLDYVLSDEPRNNYRKPRRQACRASRARRLRRR